MTESRSKLALLYPSPASLPALHRVGSLLEAPTDQLLHRGMDDNIRRRRQNEPPIHAASSSRYQQPLQDPSQQRRSFAGTPPDRYRPAAINTSPSAGARAMGGSAGYSGYYPEPAATAFSTPTMPQGAMGYHQSADYGQDTRQTQSFASTYNPTAIMYNVQQAGAQNPVYDTSQQFSSRQPAGLQMMPTDVAGPYFPSEPTNTATASNMQPQAASSSTPTGVYQQSPADRAALLQNYSSGMTTMSGLTAQTGPTPDVSMEQQDYPPASSGIDEAYASYQTALKEIFQNVRNGGLVAASESLLHVSDWLLSHVVELGMGSPPPLDPGKGAS